MPSTLIRNATILTMNERVEVVTGAVSVRDGTIASIGLEPAAPHDVVINAGGQYLLPGFIQTHIHLCQTLFRGYADDLPLLQWLRTRIWPMEAAHTPASLRAAADLACLELLRSGTTTVLTMETVYDTDAVFDAVTATGIRAVIGKCMMDAATDDIPQRLREQTRRSIDEAVALHGHYDNSANGRIRAAFAPRFAVSCSRELLEAVAALSDRHRALVHTHASEQRDEVALIRRQTGVANIEYLQQAGLTTPRLNVAHCVQVDEHEQEILASEDVKIAHCPGSNLKLGSGIAPVTELLGRGACVSLGADGAACNNSLDMFHEMRLAAMLQTLRHRPGILPAVQVLRMATCNGARALGVDHLVGSIEVGKRADLILIDAAAPHLAPAPDPVSAIVYAARPTDVTLTMVDGEVLVRNQEAARLDAGEIAARASAEARALARRAGL
ncbi:MAG TPA: 5'-deoxyadenosine deaminase [Vicinamibacterales bacterium]|nr:5'-deoxyadenosine deaminase [Vicinamibacterales bacterium]